MLAHDFLKKDDRDFAPTSSSRSASYLILLVVAKIFRCIGVFFVDYLAKQIHIIGLLWLLKLIASGILLPFQKPFSTGKPIRKSLRVRVGQLAFYNCIVEVLWFYGITFCGPLRSILVFEQNPSVVLIAVMSFVKGHGSPSKTRGVLCLLLGYLVLFVMDSDASVELKHAEAHKHHSGLNHVFYHLVGWFGISDHKGGVLLLLFSVFLKMGYDSNFRHLAVEVGGPKRLYAMTSVLSAGILTPLGIFSLLLSSSFVASYFQFALLLPMAACFVFILDFYTESICFQHVADPVLAVARWSPISMFAASLLISWMWYENSIAEIAGSIGGHGVSGGVVIATIFFSFASYILTSPSAPRSRAGHFVGISELFHMPIYHFTRQASMVKDGMPLYTHGEAFLQRTSKSLLNFFRETLREVLSDSDSRRIFWFLCANLAFCGVEFSYGFLTNSLGLISDGFHMLFDCSALVMGLVASCMARWTANRHYSYGYGRVEVLSGFINALFLIVIALFIFLEAIERLYDPPDIHTDKLMLVAVAGLCVNLFGMYAFHGDHGHSHGTGSSSECSDDSSHHGHSHAHSHSHSHSHSHGHSHGGNANMRGVFLHVLADTLGSVFVIISTLLIQFFGWQWVDPLCSLILSILILCSVCPLLHSSASTLLQCIPEEMENGHTQALEEILRVEGVHSYSQFHLWQLKSNVNVASIHVRVMDQANEHTVRHRITQILKRLGSTHVTVQVEKEVFVNSRFYGSSQPVHKQQSHHMQHAQHGVEDVKHFHHHPHHQGGLNDKQTEKSRGNGHAFVDIG